MTAPVAGARWLQDDVARIEDLLFSTAANAPHPLIGEAATHLIKAGGKRIRPTLVLLTSRAGDAGRRATDLAAVALELVHLATLYHDDVIDETETRRGVPTVHSKWGTEIAVLAGDYLFALGSGLGADAGGEVPGILAHAIAEVCSGQIVETASIDDPNRSVEQYVETIRRKTAALFRAACALGASTSGAEPTARAALEAYGENAGLAFQVVDDLLDLIGDADTIGKTPGTDLREGVFTLPVLLACRQNPELVDRLARGDRDLSGWLVPLEEAGALAETARRAVEYAEAARVELEVFEPSAWKNELEALLDRTLDQLPARR